MYVCIFVRMCACISVCMHINNPVWAVWNPTHPGSFRQLNCLVHSLSDWRARSARWLAVGREAHEANLFYVLTIGKWFRPLENTSPRTSCASLFMIHYTNHSCTFRTFMNLFWFSLVNLNEHDAVVWQWFRRGGVGLLIEIFRKCDVHCSRLIKGSIENVIAR